MDIKRAICHEAGHAVSALHFGFRVERVEIYRGMPRTLVDLKANTHESIIVLASGIAAEHFMFRNYDPDACGSDQKSISEYGGGAIENLLPDALAVIRAHEQCLNELRKLLTKRWIEGEASSGFAPDPSGLNFELLSNTEISGLCPEFVKDQQRD